MTTANGQLKNSSLGSLPDGWDVVKLAAVTTEATERNGDLAFGRDAVLSVDNEEGLVPSDRKLGENFSRYKLVRRHQFAYNPMRLNVGSIGLWRQEQTQIVSPDYIVFGCLEDRLEPEFLDLFMDTPAWREQIQQSGQGSVRIRYYYRHIAEFYLPLPPLAEQRVIAQVLRTVQHARRATEKVIAAIRQLRLSFMRYLFTYGPVPFNQADQVELKETEVGTIPAHWQILKLGDVARIGNGSTPKRTNSEYWQGGTIPWLTSGKVHERIIRQADEFVTERAQAECHLPLVKSGSVVVAITGQGKTLGHAALVSFDTCVSQHLAYVQFERDGVVSEYALSFLQGRYAHFRQISSGGGSTKGALTCGYLKTYPLPLPSFEEQKLIAQALNVVEKKLEAEKAHKNALDALFQTLLHTLMTGRIRVKDLGLAELQPASVG